VIYFGCVKFFASSLFFQCGCKSFNYFWEWLQSLFFLIRFWKIEIKPITANPGCKCRFNERMQILRKKQILMKSLVNSEPVREQKLLSKTVAVQMYFLSTLIKFRGLKVQLLMKSLTKYSSTITRSCMSEEVTSTFRKSTYTVTVSERPFSEGDHSPNDQSPKDQIFVAPSDYTETKTRAVTQCGSGSDGSKLNVGGLLKMSIHIYKTV
jgi:hypothetical protein